MMNWQDALGKYCMYMLADYVTWAAAPPLDNSTASDMAAGPVREAFTGAPAGALQQGALALFGACSPAEVCTQSTATCCQGHMRTSPVHSGSCVANPDKPDHCCCMVTVQTEQASASMCHDSCLQHVRLHWRLDSGNFWLCKHEYLLVSTLHQQFYCARSCSTCMRS